MLKDRVPPHILKILPYRPGKPISEVKRELGLDDVVKMASNENPLGPSPLAVASIQQTVGDLQYYPEDSGFHLKEKLGDRLGVSADMIVLGNGSSEIIMNVGRAFLGPKDEILTCGQSFVMYYICGHYKGNTVVQIPLRDHRFDLDALAEAINPNTRVIFVANPNNPTGTYNTREEWERFIARVPEDVLVVLDEAYCEYVEAPDYPNGLEYLSRYPNLLILRTFSKIYGLAGIRVGYGIGSTDVIDILHRVKLPFNANALGQDAAVAALDDEDFVNRSRQVNHEGLAYLHAFFAENGYDYVPSVTNFITVLLPFDGQIVFEKMQRRGVIIRPLRGFGIPNAIRVTVGRPEENRRFAEAFREVMAEIAGEAR